MIWINAKLLGQSRLEHLVRLTSLMTWPCVPDMRARHADFFRLVMLIFVLGEKIFRKSQNSLHLCTAVCNMYGQRFWDHASLWVCSQSTRATLGMLTVDAGRTGYAHSGRGPRQHLTIEFCKFYENEPRSRNEIRSFLTYNIAAEIQWILTAPNEKLPHNVKPHAACGPHKMILRVAGCPLMWCGFFLWILDCPKKKRTRPLWCPAIYSKGSFSKGSKVADTSGILI